MATEGTPGKGWARGVPWRPHSRSVHVSSLLSAPPDPLKYQEQKDTSASDLNILLFNSLFPIKTAVDFKLDKE